MKTKHPARLWIAVVLVLLTLVTVTACQSTTDTPETSGSDTPSVEVTISTTDPATEGDSTPADPTVPAVRLTPDQAVIVVSSYATAWESTAAEALVAELGLTSVNDGEAPTDKNLLVIGYTALHDRFSVDPDSLGAGYAVTAAEGAVLIVANTETSMATALSNFREALTEDKAIPGDTNTVRTLALTYDEAVYNGAWGENIAYANGIKNGVDLYHMDIRRTRFRISNQSVVFHYDMKKENRFTSITNPEGFAYMVNTGDVYLQRADGSRVYSSSSKVAGRTNAYQMGCYYYSAHILDQNFGLRTDATGFQHFSIDRTFHIYSDKVNLVQHLTTTGGEASGLAGYGQIYGIDASRVKKLVVKDASGLHETLEGVDWSTCEYVGFDVVRAGVVGFILLPYEANEGKLSVTLSDGYYTVEQHIENQADEVYPIHSHLYFGLRLYTDATHSFESFLREAACERDPLDSLSVFKKADGAAYVGYDALRGAYRFDVNGGDFNYNYYQAPGKYYAVNAEIRADSMDRKIYVYTHTSSGCLESAVLLDRNSTLLPIPMEVGKNFTGENEDSFYLPGDVSYGEVFFPITLKAGETKSFTVLNLYQNWGKYPLKQLSSIQFVAPYYHLSTGVTETNCIAPSFVYGKDNWLLPDFRAMSAPLWADQPQHTAIGQLFVVRYDTADKVTGNIENYHNGIDSYGPVYADVDMDYLSQDGRIHISYRHVEMPQTDENRTYYSLRIDVLEDVPFADFKSDFSLFCFNGRHPKFNKLTYLDENNQHQVLDLGIASAKRYDRFFKLGNEHPYFGYFEPLAADAVNFALLVKDAHITIGGEEYTGGFLMRDRFDGSLNFGDLTLDLGEVTLKAGDCIYVDYILLPWGYVDSVDARNVLNVREDSLLNPYKVTVETGAALEDVYVPKVRVDENQTAVFTYSGGTNNGVVRVYGLQSYARPLIEELVNGEWVAYTDASRQDYDGYAVYADEDGTYSVAFVINMTDAPEEGRTFRVTGK
ncbi:MAG: hypothetical protein IJD38_03685 [Clostridia bacterium]|nr:hypothetical protein [Clostridia bacterium]